MEDQEFDEYLDSAFSELTAKQDILKKVYGFGEFSRWWFDQEKETLQFFDNNDKLCLEAEVIHIGSFSPKSNTWLWSWANVSILPHLREKSERIKGLYQLTGYDIFNNHKSFEVDENWAWELAALSTKQLGALGCYRAPGSEGRSHSFLAIMNCKKVQ